MPVIIRTTATTSKTMTRSKRSSSNSSSWNCSPPSPMREQTTTTTNTSLYSPNSPEIGDQFVPNSSRVQNNIHKKTMNISNNNKNSSMNSKTQTTVFIGQTASTIICPSWSSRRMVLLAILAFFFISTTEASMDRWVFQGRGMCVGRAGCETDFQDMIFNVPSARLCRRLCDENPNCNFFTWYSLTDSQTAQSGGDVFGHICFHHQDCAQLDFKCKNCHSGPRSDNCHNRRHRTSSGRK